MPHGQRLLYTRVAMTTTDRSAQAARIALRTAAAPLAAMLLASTPLLITMDRYGAISFTPGRALATIGQWLAGLADGSSFMYTIGKTEWSVLKTMPQFALTSYLYLALPGAIGMGAGLCLGLWTGRGKGGRIEAVGHTLYAMPDFVLALLLQLAVVFVLDAWGIKLGSISYNPWDGPVLGLAVVVMAFYPLLRTWKEAARAARDASASDYIAYARSKGLPERLVRMRHVGAAIVPKMEADLPLSMAVMVASMFIVEYVFALPGVARLLFTAGFPGWNPGWMEGYQYRVVVLCLITTMGVYAAAWGTLRLILAGVRRVLTGER